MTLAGKRVLITGATGFIGNRLVEVLGAAENVEIRALVHQFMNASRIARFPVKMFGGSLLDRQAVAAAMKGVDVVYHLAFGARGSPKERRNTTVEGARIVCEEALKAGVKRVVYTSTFSVYGDTAPGELTEATERKKSGDVYADSKLEAEGVVLDHCRRGLPAIVLQPTIVYGPFSFWSSWPLQQLARGAVVLPGKGDGLCNAVYVDDVVRALLLAASADGQDGEVFLISGEAPCTWGDYYGGYARMMGAAPLVFEPADEVAKTVELIKKRSAKGVKRLVRRAMTSPRLRRELEALPAVKAVQNSVGRLVPASAWERLGIAPDGAATVDAPPGSYPLAAHLALLESRTRISIAHATDKLGYRPQVSLEKGLEKTEQWARWFGLLG